MYVSIFWRWPKGGTPPMAKPVTARTKSASARPMGSPAYSLMRFSSTRFAPLVRTRIGLPELTSCAVGSFLRSARGLGMLNHRVIVAKRLELVLDFLGGGG